MTSRPAALVAIAAIVMVSCTRTSSSFNGTPMDLYAAGPAVTDIRTLFNDPNWWVGPPSFEVRPLDAETTPLNQRFSVSQQFIHIGTAEQFAVRYTVYDTTSSATAQMTALQNAYGTSPSTPKVGDQVLYYPASGSGAAPYVFRTFVRVGQILITIVWVRKDVSTTVQVLARNAAKVVNGLKKVISAKPHPSPSPVDSKLLPPLGLDITPLGSADLPIEAWPVMDLLALPGTILAQLEGAGVTHFIYGDYVLNNDTHMEVQTSVLTFATAADATAWVAELAPKPDAAGIASEYVPVGGSPAAGDYHYFFVSGNYGVLMICRASIEGEAASRECEAPMHNTAIAWKLALGG